MSENMKRKRWTAEAKISIVIEGLKEQETISEICRKHGISQSMFYEWKDAFMNHGLDGLKHKGKSSKEKQLEEELKQAQRALGQATLQIEILKKKRGNTTAKEAKEVVMESEGPYMPLHSTLLTYTT